MIRGFRRALIRNIKRVGIVQVGMAYMIATTAALGIFTQMRDHNVTNDVIQDIEFSELHKRESCEFSSHDIQTGVRQEEYVAETESKSHQVTDMKIPVNNIHSSGNSQTHPLIIHMGTNRVENYYPQSRGYPHPLLGGVGVPLNSQIASSGQEITEFATVKTKADDGYTENPYSLIQDRCPIERGISLEKSTDVTNEYKKALNSGARETYPDQSGEISRQLAVLSGKVCVYKDLLSRLVNDVRRGETEARANEDRFKSHIVFLCACFSATPITEFMTHTSHSGTFQQIEHGNISAQALSGSRDIIDRWAFTVDQELKAEFWNMAESLIFETLLDGNPGLLVFMRSWLLSTLYYIPSQQRVDDVHLFQRPVFFRANLNERHREIHNRGCRYCSPFRVPTLNKACKRLNTIGEAACIMSSVATSPILTFIQINEVLKLFRAPESDLVNVWTGKAELYTSFAQWLLLLEGGTLLHDSFLPTGFANFH